MDTLWSLLVNNNELFEQRIHSILKREASKFGKMSIVFVSGLIPVHVVNFKIHQLFRFQFVVLYAFRW